jgi:3-methyladenine DNA glycosylase AlkC
MNEAKRKGSKSIKDLPKDILHQLNMGLIQTANLVDWAAVDRKILLENVLSQNKRKKYIKPILNKIDKLNKKTVNTITETIGTGLLALAKKYNDNEILEIIGNHNSDLVRAWAAYAIGKDETLDIKQMLQKIRPFAADKHFGVREEAWSAVRNKIIEELNCSIEILSKWAENRDENIRRFASEAARPRGVWCKHIEMLKVNPGLALKILEPLKSDDSKYVRDSVGNWLNDAGKTNPEWVKNICKKWEKESNTKETKYIIKKALRSIEGISTVAE